MWRQIVKFTQHKRLLNAAFHIDTKQRRYLLQHGCKIEKPRSKGNPMFNYLCLAKPNLLEYKDCVMLRLCCVVLC